MRNENEWIVIRDYDYKRHLPKEDCMIWITRVFCTGKRWVQKINYYAGENIEWDGALAWMSDCEDKPKPYMGDDAVTVQNVRN